MTTPAAGHGRALASQPHSGISEQAAADQRGRAAIPGIIRADAQIALPREDHGAGVGVADLELYRVFRPADPPDDADKGLIGTEL